MKGLVYNIEKYMTQSGPGFRTVVYMKGCSLNCTSCESPEAQFYGQEMAFIREKCTKCYKCSKACNTRIIAEEEHRMFHCNMCGKCVEVCTSGARKIIGDYYEPEELLEEILPELEYYKASGGGVTFSGGEPMLQDEFLLPIVKELKEREVNVAIKTSGTVDYDVFEKFIPYVDIFIWDLRVVSEKKYSALTGIDIDKMKDNLKKVSFSTSKVYMALTLVKEINCGKEELSNIIRFLSNLEIAGIYLQAYDPECEKKYNLVGKRRQYKIHGPNARAMEIIRTIFEKINDNVIVLEK